MFKKFRLALGSYFVAHRFIMKHKLWVYALVPTLINILLISSVLYGAYSINSYIKPFLETWIQSFLEENNSVQQFASYFIQLLINVTLFFIYFLIYKNLVLTILSPFLSILSEKVDTLYTGREFPFSTTQLFKDVWRGIVLSVRNTVFELTLIILCLLLGLFIPILSIIIPVLIITVESYFLGFSMMDYTNERKRLSAKESRTYVKQNKSLAFGTGIVFYLMFIIPIIGWVLAPLYGIVAGTLTVLQNDNTQAPYSDSNKLEEI